MSLLFTALYATCLYESLLCMQCACAAGCALRSTVRAPQPRPSEIMIPSTEVFVGLGLQNSRGLYAKHANTLMYFSPIIKDSRLLTGIRARTVGFALGSEAETFGSGLDSFRTEILYTNSVQKYT